jgi:hypothetical protein
MDLMLHNIIAIIAATGIVLPLLLLFLVLRPKSRGLMMT